MRRKDNLEADRPGKDLAQPSPHPRHGFNEEVRWKGESGKRAGYLGSLIHSRVARASDNNLRVASISSFYLGLESWGPEGIRFDFNSTREFRDDVEGTGHSTGAESMLAYVATDFVYILSRRLRGDKKNWQRRSAACFQDKKDICESGSITAESNLQALFSHANTVGVQIVPHAETRDRSVKGDRLMCQSSHCKHAIRVPRSLRDHQHSVPLHRFLRAAPRSSMWKLLLYIGDRTKGAFPHQSEWPPARHVCITQVLRRGIKVGWEDDVVLDIGSPAAHCMAWERCERTSTGDQV